MSILFENLIRWLSPLIPFTTEEAWQSWREEIDDDGALSCHLLTNQELPSNWNNKNCKPIGKNSELRDAFLFFHEKIRNAKKISQPWRLTFIFFKEKRLKI